MASLTPDETVRGLVRLRAEVQSGSAGELMAGNLFVGDTPLRTSIFLCIDGTEKKWSGVTCLSAWCVVERSGRGRLGWVGGARENTGEV
ncbi:hypothetical protein E2C01_066884 [Portunus trituberculatus]|uniref:Uncharacterized protein n=1 Tax=Portunus trituberculatus TaxID=210409 RepID=A0A5B7HMQ7_PORTR|nr:hypothetical protein [Portunus trituberculatus]